MATSTEVGDPLAPELVDLITEAVVWCDGAGRRAEVLAAIVDSAVDALRWRLQPPDPIDDRQGTAETSSVLEVMRAAADHVHRMKTSE